MYETNPMLQQVKEKIEKMIPSSISELGSKQAKIDQSLNAIDQVLKVTNPDKARLAELTEAKNILDKEREKLGEEKQNLVKRVEIYEALLFSVQYETLKTAATNRVQKDLKTLERLKLEQEKMSAEYIEAIGREKARKNKEEIVNSILDPETKKIIRAIPILDSTNPIPDKLDYSLISKWYEQIYGIIGTGKKGTEVSIKDLLYKVVEYEQESAGKPVKFGRRTVSPEEMKALSEYVQALFKEKGIFGRLKTIHDLAEKKINTAGAFEISQEEKNALGQHYTEEKIRELYKSIYSRSTTEVSTAISEFRINKDLSIYQMETFGILTVEKQGKLEEGKAILDAIISKEIKKITLDCQVPKVIVEYEKADKTIQKLTEDQNEFQNLSIGEIENIIEKRISKEHKKDSEIIRRVTKSIEEAKKVDHIASEIIPHYPELAKAIDSKSQQELSQLSMIMKGRASKTKELEELLEQKKNVLEEEQTFQNEFVKLEEPIKRVSETLIEMQEKYRKLKEEKSQKDSGIDKLENILNKTKRSGKREKIIKEIEAAKEARAEIIAKEDVLLEGKEIIEIKDKVEEAITSKNRKEELISIVDNFNDFIISDQSFSQKADTIKVSFDKVKKQNQESITDAKKSLEARGRNLEVHKKEAEKELSNDSYEMKYGDEEVAAHLIDLSLKNGKKLSDIIKAHEKEQPLIEEYETILNTPKTDIAKTS